MKERKFPVIIWHPSDHINATLVGKVGPEFFKAWQLHNTIKVGVFENFLPAIYRQRNDLSHLYYSTDMNPNLPSPKEQPGFNHELFNERLEGYKVATDPFVFQEDQKPT